MLDLNKKEKKNYILLLLVVFVGYLVFGFSENIKGPALPRMQNDFSLGELEVGILLSLNTIGYLLACSFTGFLIQKWGIKLINLISFGAMVMSGFFIYISMTYYHFSASYFLMYIGNGMLEINLGILAARIFVRNPGKMMNLAHFFYGLSSTVAPVLATLLMGQTLETSALGWRGMYFIMLSLSALPMIPAIFSRFPGGEEHAENRLSAKHYVKDPVAWFSVLIITFGVISELSVGGWLVNYLEKVYNWTPVAASSMLSAFFLMFTLSRLVLGSFTDKIGLVRSMIIFSGFSGLCSILGVITGEVGSFLFALAGAGIAPIYPTVMAFLSRRYGKNCDTAISFVVTVMGIGCVFGNFLIGAIIDLFKAIFAGQGSQTALVIGFKAGYIFIGIAAFICGLAAFLLFRRLHKSEEVL
jgi:fucose permease